MGVAVVGSVPMSYLALALAIVVVVAIVIWKLYQRKSSHREDDEMQVVFRKK